MSLQAMLKKGGLQRFATANSATFATVATLTLPKVARVATVAVANDQKPPVNDAAPTTTVQADLPTPAALGLSLCPADGSSGWSVVTIPPGTSTATPAKFRAASMALDASIATAGTSPGLDPDAHCWPHTTAMNGAEIDLFTARLHRFTDKGLPVIEGETLADMLMVRDREADDRRFCLECRHLSGYGQSSWRCGNWQVAGIAIRSRDAQLPADLVLELQRCNGFAPQLTLTPQGTINEFNRH